MDEISDRLRRLQDRLERLLASGWRNAAAEAAELGAEGEALAEAGLPQLGERLRTLAAAGPDEALPALAMTLAACRMLRAHLPADAPPPGAWAPLSVATKKHAPDKLVPLCRVPHGDGEAWACVRLRGTIADELVLITGATGERPWLRQVWEGSLRWRERHLLGAAGEYQVCEVAAPRTLSLDAETLQLEFNDPKQDQPICSGGGGLRLVELASDDLNFYAWLHPSMLENARSALQHSHWAFAWVGGALVAPLAFLIPGGLLRRARLVHLVAGTPADAF